MNKSKNSGNSGNIENNNQSINIQRNISFDEKIVFKSNSINLEQNTDLKSLNNYAEKLNLGRNIVYNFSDFEYRSQINKANNDPVVIENLQTCANNEQGIYIINYSSI